MKTFMEFLQDIEPGLLEGLHNEGGFPFAKKGEKDEKGEKKPSAFEKFTKKKEDGDKKDCMK